MVKNFKGNRIPYADPKAIEKLPSVAKEFLNYAEKTLPKSVWKEMSHQFVMVNDFSQGEKPTLSEKTTYGGALATSTINFVSDLGAYNPDRIPMHIYEKMSRDPTIALGFYSIKNAIVGQNFRIESSDDTQASFITSALKNIYRDTVLGLLDGVRFGFACGEKIWKHGQMRVYILDETNKKKLVWDEDTYLFDKIKFVHPITLRMDIDPRGNLLGVIQHSPEFAGRYISVRPKKIVLYSHNMEYGNFFGTSRFRNVYPAWYWSTVLTQFMLKYYERRGQPLLKMRAPSGKSNDINGNQVDNAAHALKIGQAAMSQSVVVLPSTLQKDQPMYLWDAEYLKDDQRGEMFIDILNYMETRKLRGLFIPDKMGLASDGAPHTSYAGGAGGDSLDVFIMNEESLISDIENVFNTQIIPDLLAYNFEREKIVDAEIKIDKLNYNRKMLMKDILLRMIMLAGSNIREGKTPRFLPSFRKMAELLEIPLEEYDAMFEEVPVSDQNNGDGAPISGKSKNPLNVQKDGMPTLKKKQVQDKNNGTRSTQRRERPSRERAIKERR